MARRKPQRGVGRNGKPMSAAQRAALKKAQFASARKRRKGARINKKISRTRARTSKKVAKQAKKVQGGLYTHSTQGGLYFTGKSAKAYNKGVRIHNRGQRKINRLKAKKKR